jgi:hypothetical protein
MTASIAQWRTVGRLLSPIQLDALLTQALAVDRARAAGRATAMSGAMNVLVSMLDKFKLAATADPPPADDPLKQWLAEVDADQAAVSVPAYAAGHDTEEHPAPRR